VEAPGPAQSPQSSGQSSHGNTLFIFRFHEKETGTASRAAFGQAGRRCRERPEIQSVLRMRSKLNTWKMHGSSFTRFRSRFALPHSFRNARRFQLQKRVPVVRVSVSPLFTLAISQLKTKTSELQRCRPWLPTGAAARPRSSRMSSSTWTACFWVRHGACDSSGPV